MQSFHSNTMQPLNKIRELPNIFTMYLTIHSVSNSTMSRDAITEILRKPQSEKGEHIQHRIQSRMHRSGKNLDLEGPFKTTCKETSKRRYN